MKGDRDRFATKVRQAELAATDDAEFDAAQVVWHLSDLAQTLQEVDRPQIREMIQEWVSRMELDFEQRPYGKGTRSVCTGGRIYLKSCQVSEVAGTGFEPATSRL